MRRYFASIVITIVLGSVAVWQVAWHRDWVRWHGLWSASASIGGGPSKADHHACR